MHSPHRFLCIAALLAPAAAQHLEQPRDPAGPVAAERPATAAATTVRRGPYVSVQVNVDANGNDIAGDAANEPSLAISPVDPRRIAVGWRQFDSITSDFRQNGVAYSHDGGANWTFPRPVQPGQFNSDPVLETDAAGNFYYLSYPSGRTLKLFRSTDGAVSWTGPVTTAGGDKPWLLVDTTASSGRGHVYAIWQVAHGPATFLRSTDGGNTFAGPYSIPGTPTFGTLAVDAQGTLYCAGLLGQRFGSFILARSFDARDRTRTPTFTTTSVNLGGSMVIYGTPNPRGLLGQAQVAADPARPGHVYYLCTVATAADPAEVHLVRSTDGGQTFGTPVRVNDDPRGNGAWQWMAAFAVAPDGRIDVVWADTRNGPATRSELYYAYSFDGGRTFAKNIPVSPAFDSTIGWPVQQKIGDYYHARSSAAETHVAYAATFTGGQDVYYLRSGDCNGNGTHDGLDLRNGTSFDANANEIPDECEHCQQDLGFGAGPALTVCGDDLRTAGSRASLLLDAATPGAPVLLALASARLSPPFAIGAGALVPDVFAATGYVVDGLVTSATGRLHAVIAGGSGPSVTVYAQAAVLSGGAVLLSNALQVELGS